MCDDLCAVQQCQTALEPLLWTTPAAFSVIIGTSYHVDEVQAQNQVSKSFLCLVMNVCAD